MRSKLSLSSQDNYNDFNRPSITFHRNESRYASSGQLYSLSVERNLESRLFHSERTTNRGRRRVVRHEYPTVRGMRSENLKTKSIF